ncbi:CocE/NonD family hydrolase [Amorphus sp. 3PC139-8]|uniref:CocE/NonD family hydrolase n=1 Tax=Amorphus sp. 3PC139-8 TaxID=2735676 RepID=UPI00345E0295
MKTIDAFPEDVIEEENVFIAMGDGIRLAARIWRPKQSLDAPVPAVLEFIPYRKRFGTAVRDSVTHPYLAGHGYAAVRVDLRGSGESDGVLTDEYLQQELDDGAAVIEWLAAQPWCDGRVGMMGISWGGFNALQIAAMRPPALRAIATLCSTDDRYADDVHHMGGCLLGDNLSWASVMFAYNSLPPDPALVGGRWRQMWMERLEGSGLWLETWLSHQRRDDYWRHGSVCEDYSAIQCPVLAVSGWADGYSNAVFRMLTHLQVPRMGLIGPWSHRYPHFGVPGPAIGFLQELRRWWDHWLKGIDRGLADEPMLRVWMQDSVPPTTSYAHRPGRWVAETSWPSPRVQERSYRLAPARLIPAEEPTDGASEPRLSIQSPLTLGVFAGKWCSYAAGPDLAHDQRQEDGGALVFESAPLTEPIEILGAPVVELELAADQAVAMVAARVSDVRPNDEATRVTYGLLNLTHRDGSADPKPLVPGESYCVHVKLNEIAQTFPAGHRIRLSLSTSYWPLAWPSPQPVRLTVDPAASRLVLPVRPPSADDARLRAFEPPEGAVPEPRTMISPDEHRWRVVRDLASDESVLEVINDSGSSHFDRIDLMVGSRGEERYSSCGDDFGSVKGETRWTRSLKRGDWGVRTETRTVLTSSADDFHLCADLDAYETDAEGERRVFCHSWDRRIPRDFV